MGGLYTEGVRPFDQEEYARWWMQAQHTLASARRDASEGDYDWACFKAQQAAEYAVKGLLRGLGQPAYGHALLRLLESFPPLGLAVPEALWEAARELDPHYIPARYPDAFPAGSPFQFYSRKRAEAALEAAQRVLAWVEEVQRVP